MDSTPGIKMKFCESLDRFVAIRSFTPEQKQQLFKNIKITDKKSYKRLIINASVVNYLDEIAPLVFGNNEYPLLGEIIEQELYNLCVKVNPSLDIKEVTIQVDENTAKSGSIPMLGAEASDEEKAQQQRFMEIENHLRKRIIGQDEAVTAVAQAIRKAKVGLKNPKRPVGSFIFVGQTGVGKTELAKALCEFMTGNETDLVRIDCSEFAMSHEYAKLIGAPPGYIGHNEGGYLTESVKNKPNGVVVFDEIEKAHEKVHNLLLQLLDEGILTDSKGETVSFRECVIILTTNVGVSDVASEESKPGFRVAADEPKGKKAEKLEELSHEKKAKITRKSLEKKFPPEFLNRIDDIIVFRALTKDDNLEILKILLEEVSERVSGLNMRLEFSEELKTFLVDKGTDLKYGARPLRRTIHRYVENPLAESILMGNFNKGDEITAVCANDEDGEDCAEFKVTGKFEVKEPEPQAPPVIPEFDDPPIQQEEE
ncbi:MAG: ATP-dependent Clp protease ATP-binding subunit ClpC [Clostridiales bacterium]|jgi:ATP-dependent Clp protease ATP-binding subunit ClpC|nr:ATP-dependent Clp protease ATP-binding subunit ClpC [Clostridiales bacterium]MDN5281543.1 ATP-dependent Clp protease ATP-binding subunit ClpC [Candidatus Ozemobacter sp.]